LFYRALFDILVFLYLMYSVSESNSLPGNFTTILGLLRDYIYLFIYLFIIIY